MPKKTEWLTTLEYAASRGVGKTNIKNFIAKGQITKASLKKSGNKWLINKTKADKDLHNNLDERQLKKSNVSNDEKLKIIKTAGISLLDKSLNELNKIKAAYDGALKKLEYEEKTGKLINAEQVEKEAFAIGRKIRDSLLNIPSRVSAICAAETDVIKIEDMLTDEIKRSLEGLKC